MNIRQLFDEFFNTKNDGWSEKTQHDLISVYNNIIDPVLGYLPIDEVKPKQILSLLRAVEGEGKTHQAHRIRSRLDEMYRFAIACDHADSNPAYGLNDALKPHKQRGMPALKAEQMPAFLRAIRDEGRLSKHHNDAWMTLLYTAKRRSEVVLAEWDELDIETRVWNIPAARMKTKIEHTTPLPTQVITLLKARAEQRSSKYIFADEHGKPPTQLYMMYQGIRRTEYIGKMSIHGVRTVFSTHTNESGKWTSDAIEAQLAHKTSGVRGVYNKAIYMAERRKLMQWWADIIDGWLG